MSWIRSGTCGKCGAPYYTEMINMSILPPTPRPTCQCWNTVVLTTTTTIGPFGDTEKPIIKDKITKRTKRNERSIQESSE